VPCASYRAGAVVEFPRLGYSSVDLSISTIDIGTIGQL
jgi:hypothetical protein